MSREVVLALYDNCGDICAVQRCENGRYFNYYSTEEFLLGLATAGPFASFDEADLALKKHRPKAREKRREFLDVLERQIVFFSKRMQLSKLYDEWIKENNVKDCAFSVIGFLHGNNLLDDSAVLEFLDKGVKVDESKSSDEQ